jgi:hypothetical protein
MSASSSTPFTSASIASPPSSKLTVTFEAPSTTWALVMIVPSLSTTKPDPVAVPCCCWPNASSPPLTPSDWMNTTPRPSSR